MEQLPSPTTDPPSGPDPPFTGAGTLARVECTTGVRASDQPKQNVVTTFFFISSAPTVASVDWKALTDKVVAIFYSTTGFGGGSWIVNGGRSGVVRAYDMRDAKPRPEKAASTYTPASWETSILAPREVALCLSYYATRNLARQRGRVYLGPFLQSVVQERPDSILSNRCLDLGKALQLVSAGAVADWSHCVWSRMDAQARGITNYWVNNVWDVHRERGQPETSRIHFP